MALDKIVGNPPYVKPITIFDKFGTKGNIITHSGMYIYQPSDLLDKRIPMFYRTKPLTHKTLFYKTDKLSSRAVSKKAIKVADIDMDLINKKILEYSNMRFDDESSIVKLHTSLYTLLLAEISLIMETSVLNTLTSRLFILEI
mgnify:CR=1 FL=1